MSDSMCKRFSGLWSRKLSRAYFLQKKQNIANPPANGITIIKNDTESIWADDSAGTGILSNKELLEKKKEEACSWVNMTSDSPSSMTTTWAHIRESLTIIENHCCSVLQIQPDRVLDDLKGSMRASEDENVLNVATKCLVTLLCWDHTTLHDLAFEMATGWDKAIIVIDSCYDLVESHGRLYVGPWPIIARHP